MKKSEILYIQSSDWFETIGKTFLTPLMAVR